MFYYEDENTIRDIIKNNDLNYNVDDYNEPIIKSGDGALLKDINDHVTIDMSEITSNLGHNHPVYIDSVTEAIKSMSTEKTSMSKYKATLLKKLCEHLPTDINKIHFTSSGSEAVEWAVRIAKRYTNKHEIISFWNGLHGRTYMSTSLVGHKRRKSGFGPLMPGILFSPYPNCYRCLFNKNSENCNFYCLEFLEKKLEAESSGSIAALIIEPYHALGGIVYPPKGYMKRLFQWARENEIVIILDEIQSGFGRTGKMFSYEWEELKPDIMCIGKGMGNGIHIAAVCTSEKISKCLHGGELGGGTGASVISCAAALSVLQIIEEENILNNVLEVGTYIINRFKKMQVQFPVIGDVRGLGLSIGIEFVKNKITKEPLNIVSQLCNMCYERGVYVTSGGNILSLRPPLVLTMEMAEKSLNTIEECLKIITKEMNIN